MPLFSGEIEMGKRPATVKGQEPGHQEAMSGADARQNPGAALAGASLARQSARTSRKPSSIRRIADDDARPLLSVRKPLSSVTT